MLVGHVPDLVEGVLGGAGDAQAGEQRADEADRQRRGRCPASDVQLELVADDRELAERGVEDAASARSGCPAARSRGRDEHQQQREQRDEAVVGDQRRELAGLVVAELLDTAARKLSRGLRCWRRSRACRRSVRLIGALPRRRRRHGARARRRAIGRGVCGRSGATSPCVYPIRSAKTSPGRRPARAVAPAATATGLDPAEEVALVARAKRELLLRVHRYRLRREDLEDCYGQATLELVAHARSGRRVRRAVCTWPTCSSSASCRGSAIAVARCPGAARCRPRSRRPCRSAAGRGRDRDRGRARRARGAGDPAPRAAPRAALARGLTPISGSSSPARSGCRSAAPSSAPLRLVGREVPQGRAARACAPAGC